MVILNPIIMVFRHIAALCPLLIKLYGECPLPFEYFRPGK